MANGGRQVKEASMAKDDPERAARLAEALRANLRRRKAQARAQGDDVDAAGGVAGDASSNADTAHPE